MSRIMVMHGPNMNLLGTREPDVYGHITLDSINDRLVEWGRQHQCEVRTYQSNHEGELVDLIHESMGWADGIVMNPGAFTHYSYALRDAIVGAGLPTVEVHMSNVHNRESFRRKSVVSPVCIGVIYGFKVNSYILGLEALRLHLGAL